MDNQQPTTEFPKNLIPHKPLMKKGLQKKALSTNTPLDTKIFESMVKKDKLYSNSLINNNNSNNNNNNNNNNENVNNHIMNKIVNDLKFYQNVKNSRMQSMKLPPTANELTNRMWGEGYNGYGNGFTNGRVTFIMPNENKIKQLPDNSIDAPIDCQYVPIRLEFDVDRDGFKLNDTFVWNINEDESYLLEFIDSLIYDYKITKNIINIKNKILNSINEQIQQLQPKIDNPNIDLRFPITLDITVGNNHLTDRFDWDIMNDENDPEEFAKILCEEFSLSGEFATAISHSIREQCQIYFKSLYLIGYKFDGGAIVSEDLKEFIRSNLDAGNIIMPRYLLPDFTPSLQELSATNITRIIHERERESKRKHRSAPRSTGRRGGFVLPDLATMPKTLRTPIQGIYPGDVITTNKDDFGLEYSNEYIDTPIDITIPHNQLLESFNKNSNFQVKQARLRRNQRKTRRWLESILKRRMRGDTLASVASIDKEADNALPIKIHFTWR